MAGERLKTAMGRYRERYAAGNRRERSGLLDEFCRQTGYHRKYAMALLRPVGPPRAARAVGGPAARRGATHSAEAVGALARIWEAAGHPWSVRLKALLPMWLPWATPRFAITPEQERQLLTISPRTIDRRLK